MVQLNDLELLLEALSATDMKVKIPHPDMKVKIPHLDILKDLSETVIFV